MAQDKFISINNDGDLVEEVAIGSSAGAGDASKIVKTGADGKIDGTLIPGSETLTLMASENLTAGDWVNVWDDGGTAKMRKADASNGMSHECHGFVLETITSGATGKFYGEGINTQVSGMTSGVTYFLAGTPGSETATPPTTGGHILQKLGVAVGATAIKCELSTPVIRA